MRFNTLLLAFAILLYNAGIGVCQTQERVFHQITITDGLSQSTVEAVFQDSYGYMWFGTQDGLNRYDGYEFTIFTHNPEDATSISDSYINLIYEDSIGDLWIGTRLGGLNRFDREQEKFTTYIGIEEDEQTLSANTVWSVLEDSQGTFWVGTGYGLNIMDREAGTFTRVFHDPDDPGSISDNYVTNIIEDIRGRIWLGTGNGLNIFDYDTGKISSIKTQSGEDFGIVREIYEDKNGVIWVGTEGRGLFRYREQEGVFDRFLHDPLDDGTISGNAVFSIIEDRYNNLWIATGNSGINIFDREQEQFYRYKHDPQNQNSLSSNGIRQIYESREQILWVGTFASGVNFHELTPPIFEHYSQMSHNPRSLSNNVVQAIFQDSNGSLWIGTDGGGLNRFDSETGHFYHLNRTVGYDGPVIPDVILDIHETSEGLWLATYGFGLALFNPDTGGIRYYRHESGNPNTIGSDYVFDIFESSDGLLWVSNNWGGISSVDPQTGQVTRYSVHSSNMPDNKHLPNNDARVVFEDHTGDIWMGTHEGWLSRLNRETNEFKHYNVNEASTYRATVVQAIFEDHENRLWLGTSGGGLSYFDRELDRVEPYLTVSNGLPSNVIHTLAQDSEQKIWMSTNNGIARYNPNDGSINVYSLQHGLNNREFNQGAFLQDRDGYFYFGGVNGLNRFHPDNVRVDENSSPVVFTGLYIFNNKITAGPDSPLDKHISLTERVVLPHTASVLSFTYSALNFTPNKGTRFSYKLDGFDEEWVEAGDQRRATYTNLPAGQYQFNVRSASVDGVWSNEPASISLYIQPPFWQTTWFISLMIIGIVVLVSFLHTYRLRQVRAQKIKLESLVHKRTRELKQSNDTKDKLFSIISHDLRNYASSFVGFADLIKDSAHDGRLEEVREYSEFLDQSTNQFTDFLNNLLKWAQAQSDKIESKPNTFTLKPLVEHVIYQSKSSAFRKNIELRLDVDSEIQAYADKDLIAIVIYNLINNAIKFSEENSVIDVRATVNENNEVAISVQDYGTGMDIDTVRKIMSPDGYVTKRGTAGEKGSGLGFSVCKNFVHRNNGDLLVHSTPGSGTTVTFTIPADRAHVVSEAS